MMINVSSIQYIFVNSYVNCGGSLMSFVSLPSIPDPDVQYVNLHILYIISAPESFLNRKLCTGSLIYQAGKNKMESRKEVIVLIFLVQAVFENIY